MVVFRKRTLDRMPRQELFVTEHPSPSIHEINGNGPRINGQLRKLLANGPPNNVDNAAAATQLRLMDLPVSTTHFGWSHS